MARTSETWTATDPALARLIVREKSDDPMLGLRLKELTSLDQREPGQAIFQPPSGYEIVNKSAIETSCSTAQSMGSASTTEK